MTQPLVARQLNPFEIGVLCLALVTFSFSVQGGVGFRFSDEGYLWYGAVHTLSGEIPILDFQSYDPGRHYWSAFWMAFLGEGVLALRISLAIFQFAALTLGMIVLSRLTRSWYVLALYGLLSIVWMSSRYHRVFESSTPLIAIFVAYLLIKSPSVWRHFASGVFTGLAAVLGRNLGVYTFISYLFLILLVWVKLDRSRLFPKLSAWAAGIVVGYSPMLLMFAAVPGFYDRAVYGFLVDLVKGGSTNIPKPIPWPWRVDYTKLSVRDGAFAFSQGALFLLMPVYYGVAFVIVLSSKGEALRRRVVLLAAFAVGAMYMHYSFSRADLEHLLVAMPALLVALAAFPDQLGVVRGRLVRRALLTVFVVLTCFSAGVESPFYWKVSAGTGTVVEYDIAGNGIWIDRATAKLIETVEKINAEIVPEGEGFLIAPYWPGFYVILGRDSPLRDLYFLHAQSMERQREMIRELKAKRVNWVLLGNVSLDARVRSDFRSTHVLLWEHLRRDFVGVEIDGLDRNFALLRRREAVTGGSGTEG